MRVAVIGGGVVGVCTAYYLAEAGHEVGDLRKVGEDLGAGALLVRQCVGGVAVLVEHHPVGVLI